MIISYIDDEMIGQVWRRHESGIWFDLWSRDTDVIAACTVLFCDLSLSLSLSLSLRVHVSWFYIYLHVPYDMAACRIVVSEAHWTWPCHDDSRHLEGPSTTLNIQPRRGHPRRCSNLKSHGQLIRPRWKNKWLKQEPKSTAKWKSILLRGKGIFAILLHVFTVK